MSPKNLSLKVKLLGGFLVVSSLVFVTSLININASNQIVTLFENVIHDDFQRYNALLAIKSDTNEIINQTLILALQESQSAVDSRSHDEQKNEIIAKVEKVDRNITLYNQSIQRDQKQNTPKLTSLSIMTDTVIDNAFQLISLREQQATTTAILNIEEELLASQRLLKDEIESIVQKELASIEKDDEAIEETVRQTINNVYIVSFMTVLFAIAIAFLISIPIVTKIRRLRNAALAVSNGNLQVRLQDISHDELGELATSFNQMTQRLQEVNAQKDTSTEALNKKSAELIEKLNVLEETKKAMANIMEDLHSDNAKIDEQKKILDTVIHNMPIGVMLSEPNGKSILVNQTGLSLLGPGMDPKEIGNAKAERYQFCRADGSPYPQTELTIALALSKGVAVTKDDIIINHPDGTKIAIRGTSVPIKDQQGRIVSVISVFEDITKERDIDRMKTEFISLASHQLRTPLSAINWFSEMLVGGDAGELTSEQKEFAQNISDSTHRMIELVNSLLNISRIESGRIVVDPHPTDLKELVQGVVTDLKAKIIEREQNLVVSVRDDMPQINLDPHLIRQVFMNLLTNAIKYTQKGGDITVFVSRKGDEVISQVTDNGYGIPKAQQGKMFQKFFRAENIIKVETDGTGLGLYLIKAIIESSKGRIWFESEEGKGTTFWFSLPMSGMEAKKGEVTLDG